MLTSTLARAPAVGREKIVTSTQTNVHVRVQIAGTGCALTRSTATGVRVMLGGREVAAIR